MISPSSMYSLCVEDRGTGKFVATGLPVMAEKPITIRLPVDIDLAVRDMADRTEFLREVISQAVNERIEKKSK